MTTSEQKKLLIEAERRYPKGARFTWDHYDNNHTSTGCFEIQDYSNYLFVSTNSVMVYRYIKSEQRGEWAKLISLPKKPSFNWKKVLYFAGLWLGVALSILLTYYLVLTGHGVWGFIMFMIATICSALVVDFCVKNIKK